jgi:hypothetical protein
MFMFSLPGDAREWYFSLPPASISSLGEFHADFNKHCERYYSSEFICHNCCKECDSHYQSMVVSNEIYEDEDHEEDGDALGELMELVKSLSVKIERFKSVESVEDFLVLEANVLGRSTEDGNEYFIAIETSFSAPNEPVMSYLKEEAIVEEDCSLFLHEISHDFFTFGIEKKDREIIPFLQDGRVFCSPEFIDYFDEEQ